MPHFAHFNSGTSVNLRVTGGGGGGNGSGGLVDFDTAPIASISESSHWSGGAGDDLDNVALVNGSDANAMKNKGWSSYLRIDKNGFISSDEDDDDDGDGDADADADHNQVTAAIYYTISYLFIYVNKMAFIADLFQALEARPNTAIVRHNHFDLFTDYIKSKQKIRTQTHTPNHCKYKQRSSFDSSTRRSSGGNAAVCCL